MSPPLPLTTAGLEYLAGIGIYFHFRLGARLDFQVDFPDQGAVIAIQLDFLHRTFRKLSHGHFFRLFDGNSGGLKQASAGRFRCTYPAQAEGDAYRKQNQEGKQKVAAAEINSELRHKCSWGMYKYNVGFYLKQIRKQAPK